MKGFLLLILILTALVVSEWQYWPARPPVYSSTGPDESEESEAEEQSDATNGFHLPPLEDFDEIGQRPLFFEGRRAPEVASALPQEPGSKKDKKEALKPPINLAAIIIIDSERYALVRDKSGKTGSRQLRAGDTYEDWVVNEIQPDRLILQQGKQNEQVLLREFQKVLPPKAAPKRSVKRSVKRPVKKVPRKRKPPPPRRQRPGKAVD